MKRSTVKGIKLSGEFKIIDFDLNIRKD